MVIININKTVEIVEMSFVQQLRTSSNILINYNLPVCSADAEQNLHER